MKNIYAYTALGFVFPEYVSVNTHHKTTLEISVRSPPRVDSIRQNAFCGSTGSVTLTRVQAQELANNILKYLAENPA